MDDMIRKLPYQDGTTGPAANCRSRGHRAAECLSDNVTIDRWYPLLGQIFSSLRMAELTRKMRKDWDRRARRDAMHFVNTAQAEWDEGEFFATGEENVRDHVLNDMPSICQGRDPSRMRILEIGCGVGRMTRSLAATFGEVHAVDVSDEMVVRAKHFLRNTPNAHVYRNSGKDLNVLGDLDFDFAYSFIVFQHIPSRAVIDSYVGAVSRCLRKGSMFKFQVQGHQGSSPRNSGRDTWLGASISESAAATMAARHGFELRRSAGAGTQYFWLWFYKP